MQGDGPRADWIGVDMTNDSGGRTAENDAPMKRGRTDAETATLNGWGVGTLVRGHEQWADGVGVWSTWRITAVGEECVLVKTIRRDYTGKGVNRAPDLRVGPEHTATFRYRDWTRVIPPEASEKP